MSSAPPPRALSKGTQGLRFMNRVKPTALIAEPVATPAPAPTPVARVDRKKSGKEKVAVKQEDDAEMEGVERTTAAAASSRPRVIHEGSLLSFPLLSSATSSRSFASTSYTSMPWTASVVSGRRSFGGANAEIEQLNNPSIQVPTPSTNPDSDSASSKKKRKKSDRDEIPLNVRKPSSSTTSSFQANADEIKLGGGSSFKQNPKKTRVDAPSPFAKGGFAKPKGFEDVKKGGSSRGVLPSKVSRREGKSGKGKEEEHVWGGQGSERAWDVGKESEEYESEDSGSESDSEEDFEELMITKKRSTTKVLDKEGERVKREKFEEAVDELFREGGGEKEVEEALRMAERDFDEGEEESSGPRRKGKGKKGKKGKGSN